MMRANVNWRVVHERLRASEQALDEAWTPNSQRIEAAYHRRAVELARIELHRKPASPGVPALVFRLGEERYAIEMKELAEVVRFAGCLPVPGASRHFAGVINLRGEIRAVLDLRSLVAAREEGTGETGFVLMLRRAGKEIGLKVDRIEELQDIRPEDLLPTPEGNFGKGRISADTAGARTLILLNVDAVLEAALSREGS